MLLYEISIWVTVVAYKKRQEAETESPKAQAAAPARTAPRKKTAAKPVPKKPARPKSK
jgi:hypothetical protein